MSSIETGKKQLGTTTVQVPEECLVEIKSLPNVKAQIPLTELVCGGPCIVRDGMVRRAIFGVPLDAPEGNVSDPSMQKYLKEACPLFLSPPNAEGGSEDVVIQEEEISQTQVA